MALSKPVSVSLLLLLLACCCVATLRVMVRAQSVPERAGAFDTDIVFAANSDPVRIIIPIPDSADKFMVDLVTNVDPFALNFKYRGNNNPYPGGSYPADKTVFFVDMLSKRTDNVGGVPVFNIVIRYKYEDLSPLLNHVGKRKELRFGYFSRDTNQYELFAPGAENSDPPTRFVSQGVSSVTDVAKQETALVLLAENIFQDVESKWDKAYPVSPGVTKEHKFSVTRDEQDYLWITANTMKIPFEFKMKKHLENPYPDAAMPSNTVSGVLFAFNFDVQNRVTVPEGMLMSVRYQYSNQTTSKVQFSHKETLTLARYDPGSNAWQPFKGEQKNNIFTSNLLVSTSELLDMKDARTTIAVMAKVSEKKIGGDGTDSPGSAAVGIWTASKAIFTLCFAVAIYALVA